MGKAVAGETRISSQIKALEAYSYKHGSLIRTELVLCLQDHWLYKEKELLSMKQVCIFITQRWENCGHAIWLLWVMHIWVDNFFLFGCLFTLILYFFFFFCHALPWFLLFYFHFFLFPWHCTWKSFALQSPFTEMIFENKDDAFRLAGSHLNIQRLFKGTDHVFRALGGAGREGQGLSGLFAILFEIWHTFANGYKNRWACAHKDR